MDISSAQQFAQNKFVVVKNLVSRARCAELAANLVTAIAQQRTRSDPQCPLSQGIYGDPVFTQFMVELVPDIETAIDKKIYPTYSYARLYQPGEELKAHFDRVATQIGVTITLDLDGVVWPICMADDDATQTAEKKSGHRDAEYWPIRVQAINIDIGDALIYNGNEKLHWRDPYTQGQSQSQLILSYVDQHGPHAEWRYDKRPQYFEFDQG